VVGFRYTEVALTLDLTLDGFRKSLRAAPLRSLQTQYERQARQPALRSLASADNLA
jgi:hypothetical protein